ncbi:MAG: trigger factor [Bacteroidetes bacterium]|nr:trigger factor [Bacteroidota bacterium]
METKVNIISDSEHEVEVNLSYEEIKPEIEEAYKKESKTIAVPGFRKGKVPMHMIKKMYGEAIEYQASEKIAQKKFWDVVDEKELKPISTPALTDIDFVKNEKLFFKVKYEIKPELELKDYKGIEIEKPIFKVKDEDVQKEIDYLLKQNATFEPADAVENNNCRITVNLQRLDKENNPISGSSSENIVIDLSESNVNPQIAQSAKDKKVGETFNFVFTDEHFHGEEKHVEEFNYSADITKIEKIVLPEPTEELVKKLSKDKASSLDELKAELKKNFESYYEGQTENIFSNSLINKVVENNDFTAPPGYVENLKNRLIEMEKENAKRYKQPFDERAVADQLKERAEWTAKWQIILENLAKKENISVDDSELEVLAKEEAEKTGISVDKLVKYYKDSNRTEALLEDKVVKFLKENAKIIEIDPETKLKESKEKETAAKGTKGKKK